jgi:DtxR family manganese transport transcriptional regulator
MSDSNTSAARHRRIRRDHSHETAEDYAEAIELLRNEHGKCRITDLARYFDVSHVTVTKVVARLKREGLVAGEAYQPMVLTEKGLRLAKKAKRRHKVVYEFLVAMGVGEAVAAVDAEGIEHHVSPETLRQFKQYAANLPRV